MNYDTHNNNEDLNDTGWVGTHYQGQVHCPYDLLVDLFGEPTEGDNFKTDCEWIVKFEDKTIATIYDWKIGQNYLGEDGIPPEKNTTWNIGGHRSQAVDNVEYVLDIARRLNLDG